MLDKPQKWNLSAREQQGEFQPSKRRIRVNDIDAGARGWRADPALRSLPAQHIKPSCQPAAQALTTTAIVDMTADIPGNKKRG
jgi:hypothetical protein